MRVQLVPVDGGMPLDILKDLVLIGRKEDCDLQLDHKSISKQHCVIVKADGMLLLRDLGSTNGTRVNGQRVRRAALLPNDRINIASLAYRVEFSEEEDPVEAEEYTQQMDADEVARMYKKTAADDRDDDRDSSEEIELPALQANSLPDVYEEKSDKKRKE
jgi:pSer/pThr/pTyr-binding forkhead associated (FHA) protein